MKPFSPPGAVRLLAVVLAAALASCGGGGGGDQGATSAAAPKLLARVSANAPAVVATDYYDLVQRLYVAYFGRPADAGGLVYFANNYLNAGAPTAIGGLQNAYVSNAVVKSLIDSFAISAESQALYPGDNATFINAVYRNLFNRDAELAGRDYWASGIDSGTITRANAAVAIMAGAQGSDLALVNKKNAVAVAFTASLDTSTKILAYDGLDANVVVRTMLAAVGPDTTIGAPYQPTIDAVIAQLVNAKTPKVTFAQVNAVVQARCVGCHSQRTTIPGFSPAQAGIRFDTEAQIRASASLMYQDAVINQSMPYGNITNMTDAERALVGAWYNAGQP
jgi:mono/diheme cytochrome c family protein